MANSRGFTNGSSDKIICGAPSTGVPFDVSLCLVGLIKPTVAAAGVIMACTSTSGGDGWRLAVTTLSGGNVTLQLTKSGVAIVQSTIQLPINIIYGIACRVDELVNVTFLTKPVGGSWTSDVVSDTNALLTVTSAKFVVGDYPPSGGSAAFGGDVQYPGVYTGLLSEATLKSIVDGLLTCDTTAALASTPAVLMNFNGVDPELDLSSNANNSTTITGTTIDAALCTASASIQDDYAFDQSPFLEGVQHNVPY